MTVCESVVCAIRVSIAKEAYAIYLSELVGRLCNVYHRHKILVFGRYVSAPLLVAMGSLTRCTGLRPFRRSNRFAGRTSCDKSIRPVLENADPQTSSMFFSRLPGEIRAMVYYIVIPCQIVDIGPGTMGIDPLSAVPSGQRSYQACDYGKLGIFRLPVTCRLAYAETLPVLYHQTCLVFSYIRLLRRFCDSLLQHRQFTDGALCSLRSLQIDLKSSDRRTSASYDEATLVASLKLLAKRAPRLEKLHIHISPKPTHTSLNRIRGWVNNLRPISLTVFEALGQIRGLQVFEFSVAYPSCYLVRLSAHSPQLQHRFEQQVAALDKVLRRFVHLPKGHETSTNQTERVLAAEYGRIMQLKRRRR